MTELGLLPQEWELVRLEDAADISMGQSPPSSTYNSEGKGLPFFQGKADFGDVYPVTRKWCSAPAKIAEKDDILLSVRAPIGDVNIAEERSCFGRGLTAIRANHKAEGKYLFYRLIFSKELLESKGTGTTFKEINKASVVNFPLPLPPLPEQKAIARVLSTIQKAIETQNKIIAAARELKKSLMHHLFTYGPVPLAEAEKVPLKETEIGSVPAHWEVVNLDSVKALQKGAIVSGPFGSNIGKRFFMPSGVPVIRGNNLTKGRLHFIDNGFVYLTEEKASEFSYCEAIPGDVVFTAAGTIGQLGIVPQDGHFRKYIISNKQMRIRLNTELTFPDFIFYWFTTPTGQNEIISERRGTSIPVINLSILRNLLMPLPPISIQHEIVLMLSKVDNKIEAEEKRKVSLQALFKTMLHQLMTGKVRVKDLEVTAT